MITKIIDYITDKVISMYKKIAVYLSFKLSSSSSYILLSNQLSVFKNTLSNRWDILQPREKLMLLLLIPILVFALLFSFTSFLLHVRTLDKENIKALKESQLTLDSILNEYMIIDKLQDNKNLSKSNKDEVIKNIKMQIDTQEEIEKNNLISIKVHNKVMTLLINDVQFTKVINTVDYLAKYYALFPTSFKCIRSNNAKITAKIEYNFPFD